MRGGFGLKLVRPLTKKTAQVQKTRAHGLYGTFGGYIPSQISDVGGGGERAAHTNSYVDDGVEEHNKSSKQAEK